MKNGKKKLKLNNVHVKKYFYDWYRQILDDKTMDHLQAHLKACQECQRYYQKMSAALAQPDLSSIPHLNPDPLLVQKIINRFEHPVVDIEKHSALRYLRWSFATAVVVLSFSLGVFLGKGIYYNADTDYESQLTSAYYQHFSQSSILEEFDEIINYVSEDNHED
jgi:predicted anti-sigma-YlaC factor YlaD